MIERYSRPELSKIWSDQNRYQIWLEVETAALGAMVKEGLAPQSAFDAVTAKGAFDVTRIAEIEQEVKHDVIAFLTNVAEVVGEDASYLHRGMTSSDLLDTAFSIQLKQAGELILNELGLLIEAVKTKAEAYKYLPTIGRSHGIHAEPTTMGLKFISWHAELKRARKRIEAAVVEISVGKIAGAVGTYASITPEAEIDVLSQFGLKPETVPSQIVHRDRHADFFTALAQLGSSVERFCVEIRHLQRTEVGELAEKFTVGQKGSSAMPHKMNPILTENLTGVARLLRSYAQAALENVALWHERDISHSSVERVIGPDATILTDFMLARFRSVVSGLHVFEDRVKENLELTNDCIFSGTLLLALVDHGFTREAAYKLVQKHALAAWQEKASLQKKIKNDAEINEKLSAAEIADVFNLSRHTKHVDLIFDRAISS